ncbi:hydrogenase maturation nickel metallochaperone HypA [Desulfurella sp.]|uniref:hydrogenase maturation nickel metallochaperone HypA/HybF n=1 Tax=Desulfurella sp. TaxID=1962857 RepID=UPI003D10A4F1
MHEGAIAQSVMEVLRDIKTQNGLLSITSATLKIGAVSGVAIDALLFAFEAIQKEEEFIKNTKLNIIYVNVKARCNICGKIYEFDDTDNLVMFCPDCQMPLTIINGKELEIVDVEGQ